jgi:hypothetical protein
MGLSQGLGSEPYSNSTSQGPAPEDALKNGHIRGQSRRFVNYRARLENNTKRAEGISFFRMQPIFGDS